MYLLVLLGLLGTFEMNFYGGTKTQFENGTGTKMCPSLFACISSPTFCPIFCRFLAPLSRRSFWSIFSDLSSDFFLRFSGPISCSIFCPIVRIPVWYFVRFPVGYLSNFLSHLLSDIIVRFLVEYFVRYFVLFSCPVFWKTAWTCVNGRLERKKQIFDHKNIRGIHVDRP